MTERKTDGQQIDEQTDREGNRIKSHQQRLNMHSYSLFPSKWIAPRQGDLIGRSCLSVSVSECLSSLSLPQNLS